MPTAQEPSTGRGDLGKVHEAIAHSLARVVTESGHYGVMHVHDWIEAVNFAKELPGPRSELRYAQECLEISLQYLHMLRNEVDHQADVVAPKTDPEPPW
ncbi:MAG: hypothetical protein GEV09_05570 [Pseudonocardiaceae bacterium]|nr:hypothetical protein [Pseudonocardiaceae bacterium]